jgi:predicted RNase H-like HicB family nuclease
MPATSTIDCLEAQVQYEFFAITGHDAVGYWAYCPDLRGSRARGGTCQEALDNLRRAVTLDVGDRLVCGEEIPCAETMSTITVQVPRRVLLSAA